MADKCFLAESTKTDGSAGRQVERSIAKFAALVAGSLMLMGWVLVMGGIANAQSRDLGQCPEAPPTGILACEMLKAHNAVRTELKLPPLQWSDELAAIAKKWADTLLAKNKFSHNPDSPHGENLFMISGGSASPAAVIWQWAAESQNYDYSSNTCSGMCGHYTQLVWRRTLRVGCGVARDKRNEIWVCSYDPPGNVVGQLPY